MPGVFPYNVIADTVCGDMEIPRPGHNVGSKIHGVPASGIGPGAVNDHRGLSRNGQSDEPCSIRIESSIADVLVVMKSVNVMVIHRHIYSIAVGCVFPLHGFRRAIASTIAARDGDCGLALREIVEVERRIRWNSDGSTAPIGKQ